MMEPAKDRMRNNVSEPPDVEQRGEFSGQDGEQQRLGGPFGDVFIRAKFQAQGQTGSFQTKIAGFTPLRNRRPNT